MKTDLPRDLAEKFALPSELKLIAMQSILDNAWRHKRRPVLKDMEGHSAIQWLVFAASTPVPGSLIKPAAVRPIRILAFQHAAECWADGETPLDIAVRFNGLMNQFPMDIRDDALSGLAQATVYTKGMLSRRLQTADWAERNQIESLSARVNELVETQSTKVPSAADIILRSFRLEPIRPIVGKRGNYELPLGSNNPS